jgi:hypothetical protein
VQHQLSEKAAKIVQDFDKALEEYGRFDRASYRLAPQRIVTLSCTDYVASESRMSTVNRVMETLRVIISM